MNPLSLKSMMRQKWLMLFLFCLVAGAGVPLIWQMIKPAYRANAVVRIRPVVLPVLYKVEENAQIPDYEAYVYTQVGLLLDPSILARVLQQSQVQQTSWYREKPSAIAQLFGVPPDPMDRLLKELQVRPRPRTELIDVSMETASAEDGAVLVNAVVAEYMNESLAEMRSTTEERLKELTGIRRRLENEVKAAQDNKFRILSEAGTGLSDEARLGRMTERIDELELELERMQMAQRVRAYRIERLKDTVARKETPDAEKAAPKKIEPPRLEFYSDPIWSRLNDERSSYQDKLDQIRGKLGEKHPDIATLTLKLQQTSDRLEARALQLLGTPTSIDTQFGLLAADNPRAGLAALESEYALAEKELEEMTSLYNEQLGQLKNASEDAHVYVLATEELQNKKAELGFVQDRIKSITTEIDAPRHRITQVSEARASSAPHRDRRTVYTFMVIAVGMMLSAGAGYWRSTADTAIYAPDDVIHITRAPFLGQLPHVRGLLPAAGEMCTDPVLSENMRMLRTALLQRLPAGSAVAITSPEPNAGKTSVALLLATSLGRLGKKVLLVDADVRQCALSSAYDIDHRPGLCDLLARRVPEHGAIVPVASDNLVLLPAGEASPDNTEEQEMLANGSFSAWLRRWKKQYDYVVLDTPPTLLTADARILAGQADGTILVLRSSSSSRPNVVDALAGLAAAGAKLLGTVLTGVQPRHPAYEYASRYRPDLNEQLV